MNPGGEILSLEKGDPTMGQTNHLQKCRLVGDMEGNDVLELIHFMFSMCKGFSLPSSGVINCHSLFLGSNNANVWQCQGISIII